MPELNRIPDDSLILVCDSRKALFLTNTGTPIHPAFRTLEHIDAPEAEAEDTDRPGKRFDGGAANAGFHQRSAMEVTDVEKQRAQDFAEMVASGLGGRHRDGEFSHLIIAAPPEFLGMLRDALAPEVIDTVLAEIPKRLTDVPVGKIASKLVAKW